MDKMILWFFVFLSIGLFIYSLRAQPIKDLLLTFLITGYTANILGTFVVKFNLIKYLKLGSYINAGQFYELLILPTVLVYFYKTTHRSKLVNVLLQCALFTAGLTISEVIFERYTSLVKYIKWNWIYSFVSIFIFMLAVRYLVKLINSIAKGQGQN